MAYSSIAKKREYDRKYKAKLRLTPEGREKNRLSVEKNHKKNPEKQREKVRIWSKENRFKINRGLREKYRNNPDWRLRCLLRSRLKDYKSAWTKGGEYREFLGCTFNELRIHIESLFKSGMSWSNQGEWQIDHVIPLSWFPKITKNQDKDDPFALQIEDAFHYTNLRPEWKKENIERGNKWIFNVPKVRIN